MKTEISYLNVYNTIENLICYCRIMFSLALAYVSITPTPPPLNNHNERFLFSDEKAFTDNHIGCKGSTTHAYVWVLVHFLIFTF